MEKTIKRILLETGRNKGVKDIVFNGRKGKWVVTYKNKNLTSDEYEYFEDIINHWREEDASNE